MTETKFVEIRSCNLMVTFDLIWILTLKVTSRSNLFLEWYCILLTSEIERGKNSKFEYGFNKMLVASIILLKYLVACQNSRPYDLFVENINCVNTSLKQCCVWENHTFLFNYQIVFCWEFLFQLANF